MTTQWVTPGVLAEFAEENVLNAQLHARFQDRVAAPGPPPREALRFFEDKDYKVGFDHQDVWREEHATAFTVAKAMSRDLLRDIRTALNEHLREGKTFASFARELKPQLQRRGWWGKKVLRDPRTGRERTVQLGSPNRLNIIFDTNMRTSRAAGQWERIERTSDVAPILEYNLGASQRHREEHQDLEFTRRPIDDPFWNTHFPPNGYRCKCHVIQLTESKAKTRGEAGKGARSALSPPPKINFVQRRNPRTGRTERTPDDVDPGFAFNPGKVARPV